MIWQKGLIVISIKGILAALDAIMPLFESSKIKLSSLEKFAKFIAFKKISGDGFDSETSSEHKIKLK